MKEIITQDIVVDFEEQGITTLTVVFRSLH